MEYLDFSTMEGPQLRQSISVDGIYRVLADRDYRVEHFAIAESFVFLATLSGSGTLRLGTSDYRTDAGDILLFDASAEPFTYGCTGENWNFWWFEFRCPEADSLGIPMKTVLHHPLEELPLALCTEALRCLKLQDRKTASSLLGSLLALVSRTELPPDSPVHGEALFRQADAYIRQHLATVTVERTAAHLQISERTLLSVFRTLLHVSTVEYIQMVKTDYARHLLLTGQSSVRQISELLGYADPFVFCKSFRRRFGLSPTQYRSRFRS